MTDAISGTRRTYNELRDGTLRVVIDIDPRFKADFHRLFPDTDMPVAIAPLVADFERREPEEEKPKGGALAKLAGMWCNEADFQNFAGASTPEEAADWVRTVCGVESRAQLDSDAEAGQAFQYYVRTPYMDWLKGIRDTGAAP